MSAVKSKFIEPLVMAFALPSNADRDLAGWLKIYDEQLGGFTSSVLEEAAKHVIATREVRSFPLVAECLAACRSAQESAVLRARADRPAMKRQHDPSFEDWRRASADKLFAVCPYSHEAIKGDWSWTLHGWLVNNQRQPDKHEIEQIRREGIANSKKFWDLVSLDNELVDKLKPNYFARKYIKWRELASDRLRQIVTSN